MLVLVQGLVIAVFLAVFTEVGFGATIFKAMAKLGALYTYTKVGVGVLVFLLYMLDFRFWAHPVASGCAYAVAGAGIFLMCIFGFKSAPYLPLALLYVGTPLIYMFFYLRVFKNSHISNFMLSLAAVLIVWGSLTLVASLLFNAYSDFWWGAGSKATFRARLRVCDMRNVTHVSDEAFDQYFDFNGDGAEHALQRQRCITTNETYCGSYGDSGRMCCCSPEKEIAVANNPEWEDETVCVQYDDDEESPTFEQFVPGQPYCLAAFMLWGAPVMCSVVMLIFGGICAILSSAVREQQQHGAVDQGVKVFIYCTLFGLLGVYVAASIAGASMRVAEVVKTFSLLTVGMCVALIGSSIGWRSLESELEQIPIVRKLEGASRSDLLKAVGVLALAPAFLLYCIISVVNQMMRRTLPCTKDVHGDEAKRMMTEAGENVLESMRKWNWTAVLSKVVWVGFIYFIFSVGVARLTTLGLSVLNDKLSSSGLPLVTFVYFIVGMTMFLLPPVPGVPVYLTGGIVLAPTADRAFGGCSNATLTTQSACEGTGETWDDQFAASVIYAGFWACVVKAGAILIQQKVIGGKMGGYVSVRQAVGINSITIRAIRLILQEKGLSVRKIAILVGGPDWPTSVLTGILKQSYANMIVGSAPFVFTIPMTVLAGALQNKAAASDSPAMDAAASTMLMVASLLQAGCLLIALVFIENTCNERKEELEAEELDQEVAEADEKTMQRQLKFDRLTEWGVLPPVAKFVLVLDASMMFVSVWMFVGTKCFKDLTLVPLDPVLGPINGPPLNGDLVTRTPACGPPRLPRLTSPAVLCAVLDRRPRPQGSGAAQRLARNEPALRGYRLPCLGLWPLGGVQSELHKGRWGRGAAGRRRRR